MHNKSYLLEGLQVHHVFKFIFHNYISSAGPAQWQQQNTILPNTCSFFYYDAYATGPRNSIETINIYNDCLLLYIDSLR